MDNLQSHETISSFLLPQPPFSNTLVFYFSGISQRKNSCRVALDEVHLNVAQI